jgi:hypothetical protein
VAYIKELFYFSPPSDWTANSSSSSAAEIVYIQWIGRTVVVERLTLTVTLSDEFDRLRVEDLDEFLIERFEITTFWHILYRKMDKIEMDKKKKVSKQKEVLVRKYDRARNELIHSEAYENIRRIDPDLEDCIGRCLVREEGEKQRRLNYVRRKKEINEQRRRKEKEKKVLIKSSDQLVNDTLKLTREIVNSDHIMPQQSKNLLKLCHKQLEHYRREYINCTNKLEGVNGKKRRTKSKQEHTPSEIHSENEDRDRDREQERSKAYVERNRKRHAERFKGKTPSEISEQENEDF